MLLLVLVLCICAIPIKAFAAQNGWKIGGEWYYFKGQSVDFEMARDETLEIEGVRYTFDVNSVWIP